MLVQYQNVTSSNREIGDLEEHGVRFERNMIPKKPAMQSQHATGFSNCLHMSDETALVINRLNGICACMFKYPGEAMKKAKVINGIATNLLHLPRLKLDKICRGQNTAPALQTKPHNSPTFCCFEIRGSK